LKGNTQPPLLQHWYVSTHLINISDKNVNNLHLPVDTYKDLSYLDYRTQNGANHMKLINATPHSIMILAKTGIEQDPKSKTFTANAADIVVMDAIPASGILPRVAMANAPAGDINGIPLETVEFGDIEGLPDEEKACSISCLCQC